MVNPMGDRGVSGPRGAEPPSSKTEYVLERLRTDIADGQLREGESLRQVDVAERLGVSVTPVREALRILEADELVVYLPHRGATVATIPEQKREDIYILRAEMEGLAAQLAVQRMTPARLEKIEAAHQALLKTAKRGTPTTLPSYNRDFHFAIHDTGSLVIAKHIEGLWRSVPLPSTTMWTLAEARKTFIAEHTAILKAIRDGDPDLARQRMHEHVQSAYRWRQKISESS